MDADFGGESSNRYTEMYPLGETLMAPIHFPSKPWRCPKVYSFSCFSSLQPCLSPNPGHHGGGGGGKQHQPSGTASAALSRPAIGFRGTLCLLPRTGLPRHELCPYSQLSSESGGWGWWQRWKTLETAAAAPVDPLMYSTRLVATSKSRPPVSATSLGHMSIGGFSSAPCWLQPIPRMAA